MLTLHDVLLALPWLAAAILQPLLIRRRPRLAHEPTPADAPVPPVSIIVPARNEAENIGQCVATLLASRYAHFEIVIVDDRSTDGTAAIGRALAEHHPDRIRLVEGADLPAGWVGKCWACWQGYEHARGDLLLFTDADTRHDERLLTLAVAAMHNRAADLVTAFPRQLMLGFWERVILPHVFTAILIRYSDFRRMNATANPRDVLANGQFILIRREAYEATGGHRAIRGEIIEDVRLAQQVVASGRRLFAAHADDVMSTRMYRSLGGIVEGWAKNLAIGSRQSMPRVFAPVLPWFIGLFLLGFWVAPPVALLARALAPPGSLLLITGASLAFWTVAYHRFGGRRSFAWIFPLGAFVTAMLFFLSAARGRRVTWKGRRYDAGGAGRVEGDPT